MRRALFAAAAAALLIASPAAATISVIDYTVTGTEASGNFQLEYNDAAQTVVLTSLNLTFVGGTTPFDATTAGLFVPGGPISIVLIGGDLNSPTGVVYPTTGDDFAFNFDATLPSQTVTVLTALNGATSGTPSDISIISQVIRGPGFVPEPETWAMMVVGFGAMGFVVRRRKAAVARLA